MSESEQRLQPCGKLGEYLHAFRQRNSWHQSPKKGFYDLGDVAALVDPSLTKWEIVSAPNVKWDMLYQPGKGRGQIVRIREINRDETFELFYHKMAVVFPP
jgi:hypothetical protein